MCVCVSGCADADGMSRTFIVCFIAYGLCCVDDDMRCLSSIGARKPANKKFLTKSKSQPVDPNDAIVNAKKRRAEPEDPRTMQKRSNTIAFPCLNALIVDFVSDFFSFCREIGTTKTKAQL